MSIVDVCYRVAHNYPGGVPALAARMGISKQVLLNKLNVNNDTHHLTVEQAAQIADFAECDEIAKAYAERRNMICIPVTQHQGASNAELIDLIIGMEKEKADLLILIKQAMTDGVMHLHEFKLIKKKYLELSAAIAELVNRIEGMVR